MICTPKNIANAFNEHFISTAENLLINCPDKIESIKSLDTHKYRHLSQLKVIPTLEFEIKSIIKLLKSKTSTGYDGISSRIIKHSTPLKSNEQLYDYNTRGKTNYHKLSCNTSQYQKSVTNMGVKLYNCLPNRLKTLTSVNIFKYEVKRILLENPFYTAHEFYNWKVLAIWFYFMRKSSLVCCFV
jgi:hypothetical protein